MGTPQFGETFYTAFQDLINIKECTVFTFIDDIPQSMLVQSDSDHDQAIAMELQADYVSGGYSDDPNINMLDQGTAANVQVTDADLIENTYFRRHYYRKPEISQELVILGSQDGALYYTSFYRKKSEPPFNDQEVRTMRSVAGVVVKALHRHRQIMLLTGQNDDAAQTISAFNSKDSRAKILGHLQKVLISGPQGLSEREAEVCAAIILGFSTEAIALNLSISANTVATHRKRAYSKLGISSQNELFSRYFSNVREFQTVLEG